MDPRSRPAPPALATTLVAAAALTTAALTAACDAAPAPAPTAELYPPFEVADCTTHPHLCGLPVTDLGGGDDPGAFRLVFVGDGFTQADLPAFAARVDRLVDALGADDDAFVAWAPERFHFYRVDLASSGRDVSNAERRDTPLAAWLRPTDSCVGADWLDTDATLVALAAAEAAPERAELPRVDATIVLAHGEGRANASFHGRVHLGDGDDARVLAHELGHALFGLGDEYMEFDDRACEGWSETAALDTPNVTRAGDAKWGGRVEGTEAGGERRACVSHPTRACRMLSSDDAEFCPVCEAAIRGVLDARACGADRLEPRVTWLQPDAIEVSRYARDAAPRGHTVAAAAYDERAVAAYRLRVDGVLAPTQAFPRWTLPVDGPDALAPGEHTLVAEALDARGNVGRSELRRLVVRERPAPPTIESATAEIDPDGWLRLTLTASERVYEPEVTVDGAAVRASGRGLGERGLAVVAAARADWTGGRDALSVTVAGPGGRSAPYAVRLDVPRTLASGPPRIVAVTHLFDADRAGASAPSVDALGTHARLEVVVEACAPLEAVSVSSPGGGIHGTAPFVPITGAACPVRTRALVDVDSTARRGDEVERVVVRVTDTWGRAGSVELGPLRVVDAEAECDFRPVARPPDAGPFSLAEPVRLALAPAGRVRTVDVRIGNDRIFTRPVTTRGRASWVAFAADGIRLVETPDLFGQSAVERPAAGPVRLALSATLECPGGVGSVLAAASVEVDVDTRAPRLEVAPFAHVGGPLVVDVHDERGVARVEARWPDGKRDVADRAPWTLPARGPQVAVWAFDVAGNASVVDVTLALHHEHRPAGRCGDDTP